MLPGSWEGIVRGLTALLIAFLLPASGAYGSDVPSTLAAVSAAPPPDGVADLPGPRTLAAAAVSHIKKGNALRGKAAIAEYRAALPLLERYRAAGGNGAYDVETSLALARGFYNLGDLPDARRGWRLAATVGSGFRPGHALLERGIDAAVRSDYSEALRRLADGFSVQAGSQQYFSTMSISTPDASPDLQFRRGLAALKIDDRASARQWFDAARSMDSDFGEPRLCVAVILLANGERRRAIEELLIVTTSTEGINTPDVRSYSEEQAPRAARLLIALTAH